MAKKGHFLLGLVIGSAAAVGAALLMTPETAADLKKKANEKCNQMRERAVDLYEVADETTASWREDAAVKVDQVLKQHEGLQSAVSTSGEKLAQLRNNFQGTTDQLKSQFGDATQQLKSSFEETKDGLNEDNDFDDIVLDSQSAFQEAKDDDDDVDAEADVAATDETAAPTDAEPKEESTADVKPAAEATPKADDKFSFDESDPKLGANPSDK